LGSTLVCKPVADAEGKFFDFHDVIKEKWLRAMGELTLV